MNDPLGRLWEQALVLRCQAGDDDAFQELLAALDPGVRRFVGGLLGGDQETEDAVQETWMAVHRGLAGLRNPGSLRAWVCRIARGRAFAVLRKRRSLEPLPDEPAEAGDPDSEPELSLEERERMRACLDRLPLPHREVLLLAVVEGLSYGEIAEGTGCLVGTVRSRLHYAKRALRRLMEEEDHDRR